jgi:menaquinone-dependent protoporphyrinogen oxidase
MRVLVSAASRHGSTAQIADRIGRTLAASLGPDAAVDVLPPEQVTDLTGYHALVLGSAVYLGRWLDSARKLAARWPLETSGPVWLFSSGPIGDPPKPTEPPTEIPTLLAQTGAQDHQLFAGALDRHHLNRRERLVAAAVRAPSGDYRNWRAINTWTTTIATTLRQSPQISRTTNTLNKT